MKKLILFFSIVLIVAKTYCQTNIITNGDFSVSNSYWKTTGNFNYSACPTACEAGNPYAFTSLTSCANIDNASGTLYQETQTIPYDATSAMLRFVHRTGTTNTSAVVDRLFITLEFDNQSFEVGGLTNLTNSPNQCSEVKIDISDYILSRKGKTLTLKFTSIQQTDNFKTIFRLDNVSIDVITKSDGGGVSTGCITWMNGSVPDKNTVDLAEYLCNKHIIDPIQDASTLQDKIKLDEVCLGVTNSLFDPSATLASDYYPIMQEEIYNLPPPSSRAAKAMLFLDYSDGISPLNRDNFTFRFRSQCSTEEALRVIMEGRRISPLWTGYDKFKTGGSSLFCNLKVNNQFYGYVQEAKNRKWLDGLTNTNCYCTNCLNQNLPRIEFWKILKKAIEASGIISPNDNDFSIPNNISAFNSNISGDVERGILNTNQAFFHIPTYSFPLDFTANYHSNTTDFPILGTKYTTNEAEPQNWNIQRVLPLGRGWSHSFNIYIQVVTDIDGNDKFFVIQFPDGTSETYDFQHKEFVTKGVYDKLSYNNTSPVSQISLETKDKVKYLFHRDGNTNLFYLYNIYDRNYNNLFLIYEYFPELNHPYRVSRLSKVYVPQTSAALTFYYQPETNFLSSVKDNSGREIKFYVNKYTETLDSVINAEGGNTSYVYGSGDEAALLKKIIKPNGNTVNNTYLKRKLHQTSNSKYVINVDFTANYLSTGASTSAKISVTPKDGQMLTTEYRHNSSGRVEQIQSNTEDKSITYGDTENPTFPTQISDNNLQTVERFKYDFTNGNLKTDTWISRGETKIDSFEYNSNNDIVEHTWPNKTVIHYTYDSAGNLIQKRGPHGLQIDYTPNVHGQITQIKNTSGSTTNLEYLGTSGNLSKVSIDGSAISASASYDSASRLTSITNPNGSVDKYTYDNNDNITEAIKDAEGLGLTTSYRYDPNENLTHIIDPKRDSTNLTYDFATDDLKEEQSSIYKRSWDYNPDGTSKSYTNKNGHQFTYEYYSPDDTRAGLLKNDGYAEYIYDQKTRLLQGVKKTDDNSTINYEYDGALRINKVTYSGLSGSDVSYVYDNSDNITSISFSKGTYHYSYDSLNRVKSVKDWNNALIVEYEYRADGMLTKELLGNGVIVNYHYDTASRVDSIWSVNSNGSLIHAVGASLDSNGNHIRESSFVSSTLPTYTFPLSDEPLTYSYENTNRLQSINSYSVADNFNGDQLTNTYTGFQNSSYDEKDNLLGCTVDGLTKSFEYDALGNRRSINKDQTFILDQVNNSNVLYASSTNQLYVHSPNGLICSIDPSTGEKEYYVYDFRGSTMAVIDGNQEVKEAYSYDPFGSITESSSATPGSTTPFLYVGKYGVMYESPHLYYMRARYYDPTVGRFLSEDPEWSTNLFPYAGNNPLTNIDPNGNIPLPVVGMILDIGLGAYDLYKGNYGSAAFNFASAATFGILDDLNDIVKGYNILSEFSEASVISRRSSTVLGKLGEEAVGIENKKSFIPSLTQTANYRVPEELTASSITEVKNVNRLSLTNQINDFLLYSQQNNLQFNLYTRTNTIISKPLQALIDNGSIILKRIPGF